MKKQSLRDEAIEAFARYGENYVQFFILDYDRLEEWRGLNFPAFCQALANANAPAFCPLFDLRRLLLRLCLSPKEELFFSRVAFIAAFDRVTAAFEEAAAV